MMFPTARAAPGRPARRAMSPYVATRPTGMRRTRFSTRAVKSDGSDISLEVDALTPVRKIRRGPSGDDFEREVRAVDAHDDEMMRVLVYRHARLHEVLDTYVLRRVLFDIGLHVWLASICVCRCAAAARDEMVHPVCRSLIVVSLDEVIEEVIVAGQRHTHMVHVEQRQ